MHEVHCDTELSLSLQFIQSTLPDVHVHAQRAQQSEEMEAVVRLPAVFREDRRSPFEERYIGATLAALGGDAADNLCKSGGSSVRLGVDVLTEHGRRNKGDARTSGRKPLPDLNEVLFIRLQGRRLGELAEDPIHEPLDGRKPCLQVIRADEHRNVRGPASDNLVQTAADIWGTFHVHPSVQYGQRFAVALREACTKLTNPVGRQVATGKAVADANDSRGLRRLLPNVGILEECARRVLLLFGNGDSYDRQGNQDHCPADTTHDEVFAIGHKVAGEDRARILKSEGSPWQCCGRAKTRGHRETSASGLRQGAVGHRADAAKSHEIIEATSANTPLCHTALGPGEETCTACGNNQRGCSPMPSPAVP
mmetsp:Transcript_41036/g.112984  ORF Transcript_41036/g.112984 Transcript_41036/m.112984 type:complete len:366 (+) Transcript_41036:285-1382(+)